MKNIILLFSIIAIITSCNFNKSEKQIVKESEKIRLNQLGYYPTSIKQFVVVDEQSTSFEIINEDSEVIFKGNFKDNGEWNASGEKVLIGDFSKLSNIGKYYILTNNNLQSFSFEIKNALYADALNAAIKSYYFQRASMPIEEKYAGKFKRSAGHIDSDCKYHPSTGHSSGSLNSSGGWYDAGDYGKYIGNASVSVGQMLLLFEQYPNAITDGSINIPESGNGISDLADELKYELNWILSMQDTDGGVFHKLTAKSFSGFIMPEDYDLERWIIGKSTTATLNFAAVLAQASRLYKNYDKQWSENVLQASEKAWNWAIKNNNIQYTNPNDVKTGEYGDEIFSDDFFWAAAELYISTQNKKYLDYLKNNEEIYSHQLTNSWKFFARNNAFHSLLENKELLDDDYTSSLLKNHLKLADEILSKINKNPYRIALNRFEWGSNSDILNQAMILCIAHRISGDEKYIDGGEQINDYIFGKNATGYCFMTGFGSKKVMHPHHRPSVADGIEDPIPGFIVGGPNKDRQDKADVKYISEFPAKSYMDTEASYASNEVCLNWNAPAVYVLAYFEENR